MMSPKGEVIAEAGAPLPVSRPGPLMSEQDPASWWSATEQTIEEISEYSDRVARYRSLGPNARCGAIGPA